MTVITFLTVMPMKMLALVVTVIVAKVVPMVAWKG